MLLPTIAIAAIYLFGARFSVAQFGPETQSPWGFVNSTCSDPHEIPPIEDMPTFQNMIADLVESATRGHEGPDVRIPLDHCTQVTCANSSAILYCNHEAALDNKAVWISYAQVVYASHYLYYSCAGNGGQTLAGRVWYNKGASSVVVTRQECREEGTTFVFDGGRTPSSASGISSSPSSTSGTSSRTSSTASVKSSSSTASSSAGSEEVGSPAPTTVQNKPPKSTTAARFNWKSTVCFNTADDLNKAVLSLGVVQDNLLWIADNVGKVPRNPGVNNCTRLACHRNSAVWFCNDDGDEHNPLEDPNMVVAAAQRVVDKCRSEVKNMIAPVNQKDGNYQFIDAIAGEVSHKDNWRVVIQAAACEGKEQGEQVIKTIPPSGGDDDKSNKPGAEARGFLRGRRKYSGIASLDPRNALHRIRACNASAPARLPPMADKPPGYQSHYCFGFLKNASWPAPVEGGIEYLEKVGGHPSLDGGKCDRVSCSHDTAISWCNENIDRVELDSFKQIAAAAKFVLLSCDVPASDCWVGHDISGQVFFQDKWSVVVSASLEHC